MSDRDTVKAVIAEVGTILEADAALVALFANDGGAGSLRYHYVWAPPNCEFPYLTADAKVRPERTEDGYQEIDLRMDIWTCDSSADGLFSIRAQIIALLERRVIEATEFKGRVKFDGDFDLSQPEAEVWRRSTNWTVRLYPNAEIAAIKAR